MITIAEPKEHIAKLWSKPKINPEAIYRLMRYTLRVEEQGKTLLHNVVTGQLVVLDADEQAMLDKLPSAYLPVMDALISAHFLVTENYDEHKQVVGLRTVLRKLDDAVPKSITQYTILPTTACNARCYYCFEHGVVPVTMTEQTANDVVTFIRNNCGEKKSVSIEWFGGEPTVAANRIDQICEGLQREGIRYTSTMISNGYLFDEDMIRRAKELWNLKGVQISVDGTEANYNRIKNYKAAEGSPYQRVLRNVGLLIENGMRVGLRMNFDVGNAGDFQQLLKDAKERYADNELLDVYAFPVIGEYPDSCGKVHHGSREWFAHKLVELNDLARESKSYHRTEELPYLQYRACETDYDSYRVILPDGRLSQCAECLGSEDAIGNIRDGITSRKNLESWRVLGDCEMCVPCAFYPRCAKLLRCNGFANCIQQDRCKLEEMKIRRVFLKALENKEVVEDGL